MDSTLGILCKTPLPLAHVLRLPRNGGFPMYCDVHVREILAERAMDTFPFQGERLLSRLFRQLPFPIIP